MRADAARRLRRSPVVVAAAYLVGLALLVYLVWAAWLAVTAGETNVLPPRRRDPDIPAGSEVLRERTMCASGGCWREVVLRPADGRTPEDLADEMGFDADDLDDAPADAEESQGWRWYDPHSVFVNARRTDAGTLIVSVGYVPTFL